MGTQLLWQHKVFFLIKPSSFNTLLIVRSEGKLFPDLVNSHLIDEAPIWANGSLSSRFLVAMIRFLSVSGNLLGLPLGALDSSVYHSG